MKSIKTGKSLLAFLLSAVMLFATIPAIAVHAETADGFYSVEEYKSENATVKYPTQDGKVFAGWFTDASCETAYTQTTGTAYAKFVDAGLMVVKFQFNSDATVNADTVNIRFLTAIKDTKLASVTFNVALESLGKSWNMEEKSAYKTVLANGVEVAANASSAFNTTDATYFVVHTLNNVPKAVYGENFTAYVSWTTLDGTVVTGETRTFNVNDELENDSEETVNWTTLANLSAVKGLINNCNATVDRTNENTSVGFMASAGFADAQLICQFAEAAEYITAFEISTTVTAGEGRRGVGFKTPGGYLFFNVVKGNTGNAGVGYVKFAVDSTGTKDSQAYEALSASAEEIVAGSDAYTLKLVATNLTGTADDKIYFYVNDILVYTYTNTLGLNLTGKIIPSIGIRGDASATFTNYTCKVEYCEHTGTATCKTSAVCTTCGATYLDSENHEGGTGIRNAKEQIGSADGYTGDTYCLGCDVQIQAGETIPTSGTWTNVALMNSINGFINENGTLTRPSVSGGAAGFATYEGNAANQLLCQFADAAVNVKAFEISTTVTAGAGRRGIGFKTPDGYLFFNVVANGGENGAGYVEFDVNTDGNKKNQAYQALSAEAEAIIAGDEAYTLKLVATDLTGATTDTVTLYVNNIAVYTYTDASGWDLTEKILPAIGVRGSGASATFTDYTFRVQYEA